MDYNQTVHLPQTDFPMRAGLPRREPEMLQAMYDHDLYHKLMKKNEGKPLFVLHDGPPYANGNIHIGTALNKILKDIIVKHRNMTGWCAPYVPGWDTHGLPIESAILKNKKIKRDELTTAQFREKCKEYALDFVDKQREQFKRLGVLGEWDDPYLTLKPAFEAKQVEIFGKMAEKGFIFKGMKPVYWCPNDQTALAEAEIEYADDPCTTLFVKFPVRDDKGRLAQYADLSRTYFVIWTTTPWTIPGNMAICVNADFDYVLLQAPNGEVYILARDLAERVCKAAGIDYAACRVLATLKGSAFELMTAKHPLFDRESVLLCGEHVTLDAGTGCVHTAPGFGADDFNICRAYDKAGKTNIGVPVPVNARGVMTDERYNGQFYAKGNDLVVEDLEAEGFLLAKENITHSYPHCWRCKHPIIYRATESDIMDVWFDSGSTHAAVLDERPYLHFPADVYLEGGDQYRGWFQSSMLTSIAAKGVAPYKQIITHGWTVDGEGKAMHKSLGNAVGPEEVIKDYGADMLRLWVASADYTQDMRISGDIMKQLSQAYLKIRNTARYMLGNLCDFDPDADLVAAEHLMGLDRYALHLFNQLVKTVRAAYDRYEFHAVYRAVYNFCVVDLSNFYLDIIKDRLYCGDEAARRSAQTALYVILDGMTRLIAPILAFTSDEIWHAMRHGSDADAESVLFNDMPGDNAAFALAGADQERWEKLVSLRDAVNKALENARTAGVFKKAQDTEVTLSVSEQDAAFLAGEELATLCIVSSVIVTTGSLEGERADECRIPCTIAVRLSDAPKCPRCWNHNEHVGGDPEHPDLCPRCAGVVRGQG